MGRLRSSDQFCCCCCFFWRALAESSFTTFPLYSFQNELEEGWMFINIASDDARRVLRCDKVSFYSWRERKDKTEWKGRKLCEEKVMKLPSIALKFNENDDDEWWMWWSRRIKEKSFWKSSSPCLMYFWENNSHFLHAD